MWRGDGWGRGRGVAFRAEDEQEDLKYDGSRKGEGWKGVLHIHLRRHAHRGKGAAPEVQVSHASAACLALAGTEHDLSPLLNAPHKLLSLGLHPFLQQHTH